MSKQVLKERYRKRIRFSAKLGLFIIPFLTLIGLLSWQYYKSQITQDFIILVAKFDSPGLKDDRDLVTTAILSDLEKVTKSRKQDSHITIKYLNKNIKSYDNAVEEAIKNKAEIIIWGSYRKIEGKFLVSVNFNIINQHTYFQELPIEADGTVQILDIGILNSVNLHTRLSKDMSYLSLFTLGMYRYLEEDWNQAIKYFGKSLDTLGQPGEAATYLGQEFVHFFQGFSYFNLQKYDQAISEYTQAIYFNNQFSGAYNNRGVVYAEQGKYQEAIYNYNQAVLYNPEFAEAYNNLGNAFCPPSNYQRQPSNFNQGKLIETEIYQATPSINVYPCAKYEQAVLNYAKAINLNKNYSSAYNNRGVAFFHHREFEKAIFDYNKAIQIDNENEVSPYGTYHNLGDLYLAQGNLQKAISFYNKAIKSNDKFALAYLNRGLVFYQKNKYQKAISDFSKAIEVDPELDLAYYNRGLVHLAQGNYHKAIADFDLAISIFPNTELYNERGIAYAKQGDFEKAISSFNEAIKLDPGFFLAYANLGYTYYEQGDYLKAISDSNQALSINSSFALAYNTLGLAFTAQGYYIEAISNYNRAIKIAPQVSVFHFNRAIAYHHLRDYSNALDNYKKEKRIDNNIYFLGLINVGFISYEFGSIDEAIKLWRKATSIFPENTEVKLALSVALYNKGKTEKGFTLAEKALKSNQQLLDFQYLKKHFWGDFLLADTNKLLSTPRIQEFLSSNYSLRKSYHDNFREISMINDSYNLHSQTL